VATLVSEVMSRGVCSMSPDDTLQRAAQAMQDLDVGALPVCENHRVVGMVTDRDLVVRGIASGRTAGDTALRDVMSALPQVCYEDQPVDDVVLAMRDERIRRVPVLDRDERLVGMLSLGDVAAKYDAFEAGVALAGISDPGATARDPGRGQPGAGQAPRDAEQPTEEGSRIPGLLRG
jgi:CBS domain-containing protein